MVAFSVKWCELVIFSTMKACLHRHFGWLYYGSYLFEPFSAEMNKVEGFFECRTLRILAKDLFESLTSWLVHEPH